MNNLNYYFNGKIINFDFNNILLITRCDIEFYDGLLTTLNGKTKNSYFNRQEIQKNTFVIYELLKKHDLETDLKYGTKSFSWKLINSKLSNNIDKYQDKFDLLNKTYKEICNEINNDLQIEKAEQQLDFISLIKDNYKPLIINDISSREKELFLIKLLLNTITENNAVLIINSDFDFLDISQIFEILNQIVNKNIICIINTNNINLLSHAIKHLPIFNCHYKQTVNNILEQINNNSEDNLSFEINEYLYYINLLNDNEPDRYIEFLKKQIINENIIANLIKIKKYIAE